MNNNDWLFSGVIAPVLTPFKQNLGIDEDHFVRHCTWLLNEGCTGLAPFGTTSEGNSLSVAEKARLLEVLCEADIPPHRLLPGTGACALSDAVEMTRQAVALGCGGVLMLPPFYYQAITDQGLFDFFARVIDQTADSRLRIYLYHIPPVARIGFSLTLIEQLIKAFPDTVVGIKDSSGDWHNTLAMLEAFPEFCTFVGTENYLLANLRGGGAGCITATANVNPGRIRDLYDHWQEPESVDADALQATLVEFRACIMQCPAIPALKYLLYRKWGAPEWRTVRPPLEKLDENRGAALTEQLVLQHGYSLTE